MSRKIWTHQAQESLAFGLERFWFETLAGKKTAGPHSWTDTTVARGECQAAGRPVAISNVLREFLRQSALLDKISMIFQIKEKLTQSA